MFDTITSMFAGSFGVTFETRQGRVERESLPLTVRRVFAEPHYTRATADVGLDVEERGDAFGLSVNINGGNGWPTDGT